MVKCIGFDVTEDHRTYATSAGMKICPEKGLPAYSERYVMRYPLREWGLDRAACGRVIVNAGLPLPPKSACFFCPSMKHEEIRDLEHDDLALALEMERRYREGRHFRGDNVFTLKAVHKETKEKLEVELTGRDPAEVRLQFRTTYHDTVSPYRYDVAVSAAVVGLGRDRAWSDRYALQLLNAS